MNKDLLLNNYLIVKNFIDSERAIRLDSEFKLCDSFFKFTSDPDCPNSSSVYNYLPALEILCEKTPEVSNIIGESVLPTYAYSRIYRNASILTEHTDRNSCEISVTLHLSGDKPWPIWIKTPEGKPRCVNLDPGDAMIYLGCVAPHWRDEYIGESYSQTFLHYVRSRGSFSGFYFDAKKEQLDTQKIVKEYVDMGWISQEKIIEGKVKENPYKIKSKYNGIFPNDNKISVDLKNNFQVFGDDSSPFLVNEKYLKKQNNKTDKISDGSLKEYIKVFDGVISNDICDLILNEYADSNEWYHTLTGSGHDPSARNCSVIGISHSESISKNEEKRKYIDEQLFNCVSDSIKLYEKEFPNINLEIKEDSGYELLKYTEGQFYVEHTDSFKEMPRALTWILSLNDDYDGGEISFFSRELTYKLKKGSIIMFPSNFMYPHEIREITNGTRYSIITWIV
jgi:hypothetical protein